MDPVERHLSPEALLGAYSQGAFPMADPDDPSNVLMFVADPRGVIPLERFREPRSVRRALVREPFEIRINSDFAAVVQACARSDEEGVWLSPPVADAYVALHRAGFAASVEAWREDELVGGLFGVALGRLFTSESMFHRASGAGNACLVACGRALLGCGATLWDIQMVSEHTRRFGAVEIAAEEYDRLLAAALSDGIEPRFPQ